MDDDRHLEVIPATITVISLDPPDAPPGRDEQPKPPRPAAARTVLRLKIALAVAVAAAVALAAGLYYTQHPSDAESEATEAVAAYTKAWNAHDLAAVKKSMAGNGTFSASDALDRGTLFTAYIGPELDRVLTKLFDAGVELKTPGKVTIAGDDPTRVSVAQEFSYTVYGLPVHEDGISHYTLGPKTDQNPKLVVVQHVFWRPRTPGHPSMLWILES